MSDQLSFLVALAACVGEFSTGPNAQFLHYAILPTIWKEMMSDSVKLTDLVRKVPWKRLDRLKLKHENTNIVVGGSESLTSWL